MRSLPLIFLFSLIPFTAYSKEVLEYTCPIDKNLKVELSLLDKSMPTVSLYSKKSKFASCQYESTPQSTTSNPRAQIEESQWHLKLKKCDIYFEKEKDKIKVVDKAMFKESKDPKRGNFFFIVEGQQPLKCLPRK